MHFPLSRFAFQEWFEFEDEEDVEDNQEKNKEEGVVPN